MGGAGDRYKGIDANIAANVRAFREARGLSQEELAGQLADAGFPFSQATIWKVENGQRPLKAAELVAMADALGFGMRLSPMDLTSEPDSARHIIGLEWAVSKASTAWDQIKDATSDYLEAQLNIVFRARAARDAGLAVTELQTSWLTVTPEEAVIQARVDKLDEDTRVEKLNDEVVKIIDALRANGYEPHLYIENVVTGGGEDSLAWMAYEEKAQDASSPADEPVQRTPGISADDFGN